MGRYDHAIEMLDWLDKRGLSHDLCLHSKHVPGCPSCTQHLLDWHKINLSSWSEEKWRGIDVRAVQT